MPTSRSRTLTCGFGLAFSIFPRTKQLIPDGLILDVAIKAHQGLLIVWPPQEPETGVNTPRLTMTFRHSQGTTPKKNKSSDNANMMRCLKKSLIMSDLKRISGWCPILLDLYWIFVRKNCGRYFRITVNQPLLTSQPSWAWRSRSPSPQSWSRKGSRRSALHECSSESTSGNKPRLYNDIKYYQIAQISSYLSIFAYSSIIAPSPGGSVPSVMCRRITLKVSRKLLEPRSNWRRVWKENLWKLFGFLCL